MNTFDEVIAKKAAINEKITTLQIIVDEKKPLKFDAWEMSEADLSAYEEQESEKIEEEIEIETLIKEIQDINRATINNPYWVGYVDVGRKASVWMDGKCVWLDDNGNVIGKLEINNDKFGCPLLADGQYQLKVDLGKPITKQRLIEVAEKIGAKNQLIILEF